MTLTSFDGFPAEHLKVFRDIEGLEQWQKYEISQSL